MRVGVALKVAAMQCTTGSAHGRSVHTHCTSLLLPPPLRRRRFAAFNQSSLVDASDLCVGSTGANSTCSGDSGGPLLLPDGVQVGVTSHGLFGELAREGRPGGCGSAGQLTTFASVAHLRPWIDAALAAEGLL